MYKFRLLIIVLLHDTANSNIFTGLQIWQQIFQERTEALKASLKFAFTWGLFSFELGTIKSKISFG